jgi:putative membrane protein
MVDWRHWHNEPYLIGGLILLGWLYAIATGPLRRQLGGPPLYPHFHAACFSAALLIFYLAVGSPLDQIAERFLLSAHMLQHLLLIYPAAALFLLGLPPWIARPLIDHRSLRPALGLLTNPIVCGLIYVLTISVWHMPLLYDWALQNKLVHVWEHLCFFGAALFFWWPLLSPSAVRPPVAPAGQILYLLGVIIGMTPLFAYLTFSSDVLYPTYEYAPRLIASLSPSDDQLLAGVGMKLTCMAVALLMISFAFRRWYRSSDC